MHTLAAIAIYTPFAVITAIILILELFRSFKRHEDYLFTFLCLSIACWFATDIASLFSSNFTTVRFLYNFKLIFVGLVPPFLLLFVLRFYKVELGKYQRPVLWLLFTIPAINVPIVLTSPLHSWMIDIETMVLAPYRSLSILWGPWFWVHTVQSYIVSIIIVVVVFIRHIRMPRFYRLPSSLMSLGILITLLGNVVTLMQILPPLIDLTLITSSLSMILFDFAIINNNKSKFVHFSHKHIYQYLDEYILVLDDHQRVLEWNQRAEGWFARQGILLRDSTFPEIMDALLAKEGAEQKEAAGRVGTDIYLLGSDFPEVHNLRLHEITDVHGDMIGTIAVFTDITQTWSLIKRLEEKAGMDSLTGIPNHMAYIGAKKRLDAAEHLPLSIVVCDANGLKQTNDNLGHQYGDLMLKVVAKVLEQECATDNFVARTGGDEFICLLPHTDEESARQKVKVIQHALSAIDHYPFPLSLAMGISTKYHPDEDIDSLIALADNDMYKNKKMMKAAQLVEKKQVV